MNSHERRKVLISTPRGSYVSQKENISVKNNREPAQTGARTKEMVPYSSVCSRTLLKDTPELLL